MRINSVGRKVTVNTLINFLSCPRKALYCNEVSEYDNRAFYKALRNTFNYYMLTRKDNVLVYEDELRRFFAKSYEAYDVDLYNLRPAEVNVKNDYYEAAVLIKNFMKMYGGHNMDVLPGFPEDVNGEFCLTCKCGLHYVTGAFDVIYRHAQKDYITIYNMLEVDTMSDTEFTAFSQVPSLYLYLYQRAYKNPTNAMFRYYYPAQNKIVTIGRSQRDIDKIGDIICIAAESIYKKAIWKLEDKAACNVCKYYNMCHNLKGIVR